MKIFDSLVLGSLLIFPQSWAQQPTPTNLSPQNLHFFDSYTDFSDSTPPVESNPTTIEIMESSESATEIPSYDFRADLITSTATRNGITSIDATTDITGLFVYDFDPTDTTPEDTEVASYLPEVGFRLSFTSSNMSASVAGANFFSGANQRTTVLRVRNNLSTQLSPEQTVGSDVIDIDIPYQRSFTRGGDTNNLSLQLIDSTGTALSSTALPESLDFSAFDTIRLYYTSVGSSGSGTFAFTTYNYSLSAEVFLADPNGDAPVLSVSASPVNEGLIGYPVTFTLSQPAQGGERFSFALESDQANVFEDFFPYSEFHEFTAGETSLELLFTLKDDATIEPDESFNLVLSDPVGLTFEREVIPLIILNDDTLLDDYGSRFGLSVEERSELADGDGDGLPFIVEFAFNLDPTLPELPCYEPGLSYQGSELPFGLPVLAERDGELKYLYPRRTDSTPRIEFQPEFSVDGLNFNPATVEETRALSDNWEEVQISVPISSDDTLPKALLRVRLINNEQL